MKSFLKILLQVATLQGSSAYTMPEITHWLSMNTGSTLRPVLMSLTQPLNCQASRLSRLKRKVEVVRKRRLYGILKFPRRSLRDLEVMLYNTFNLQVRWERKKRKSWEKRNNNLHKTRLTNLLLLQLCCLVFFPVNLQWLTM